MKCIDIVTIVEAKQNINFLLAATVGDNHSVMKLRDANYGFIRIVCLQVCWAMLAITIAIRIDVYGVIYAVVLGILFLAPRSILPPIWLVYLPVHGVLLAIQYFFLLGAPPSVCYNKPGSTGNVHCVTFRIVSFVLRTMHLHVCKMVCCYAMHM